MGGEKPPRVNHAAAITLANAERRGMIDSPEFSYALTVGRITGRAAPYRTYLEGLGAVTSWCFLVREQADEASVGRASSRARRALVADANQAGDAVFTVELDPCEGSGVIPNEGVAYLQPGGAEREANSSVHGKLRIRDRRGRAPALGEQGLQPIDDGVERHGLAPKILVARRQAPSTIPL